MRLKTTEGFERWWKRRKIDWNRDYLSTINHPHRDLIVQKLSQWKFNGGILEVGCASGPNLLRIRQAFPHLQVGGVDVVPEAIEMARKVLPGGIFDVRSVTDLFFADKSVDVVLTDACLIYVGPGKIKKALKEIHRVCRGKILLVEFHSNSFFKRCALRLFSGYNAYRWDRLLEDTGFVDVEIEKIPKEVWPGTPWEQFGYVISARV